eukprot:2520100-Rhodomonas_salina.2
MSTAQLRLRVGDCRRPVDGYTLGTKIIVSPESRPARKSAKLQSWAASGQTQSRCMARLQPEMSSQWSNSRAVVVKLEQMWSDSNRCQLRHGHAAVSYGDPATACEMDRAMLTSEAEAEMMRRVDVRRLTTKSVEIRRLFKRRDGTAERKAGASEGQVTAA